MHLGIVISMRFSALPAAKAHKSQNAIEKPKSGILPTLSINIKLRHLFKYSLNIFIEN